MAILPDKILSDQQISSFVARVNSTADKIVGDSKFEIPNPALPGLGLVIKLQIRTFEKSIASFFAPILLGKQILNEAFQKTRILKYINEQLQRLTTLFTNPIQFLLDEGINSNLRDFPFPIFFLYTPNRTPTAVDQQLQRELEFSPTESISNDLLFPYQILFETEEPPSPGFVTTTSNSLATTTELLVNYTTQENTNDIPLLLLKPGDYFSLEENNFSITYQISEINFLENFAKIFVQIKASTAPTVPVESQKVFVPGFSESSIRISRRINLRQFLTPDSKLIIPFSALGINLPLISDISLELGNFDRLNENNPTYIFVKNLENFAGLNFAKVLAEMIDGVFPQIDWEEIQKQEEFRNIQEKSKLEIVNLARFIQIGTENPFFLIRIILNYIKLLFLPISVFISVITSLASEITNPFSLIRTVLKFLSNPLKFVCDIISEAFLNFLRTYLEPPLAPIIPWNELREDPQDKSRGLKPLFSDLICGLFSKKLNTYQPNANFFAQESNKLRTPNQPATTIQLSYTLSENPIPADGDVSLESVVLAQNKIVRFSPTTNTVENGLAYLASLKVGDSFYLTTNNQFQNFRITSQKFVIDQTENYFEYGVQAVNEVDSFVPPEEFYIQNAAQGIVSEQFKISISFLNPNLEFLFILEKYLPIKAIAAWESIKGIFAITVALAIEVPSLIADVSKAIFSFVPSTDGNKFNINPTVNSENLNPTSPLLNSTRDYLTGFISTLGIDTDPNSRNFGEFRDDEINIISRDFFRELNQNEIFPSLPPEDPNLPGLNPGIQLAFLELQKSRQEQGLPISVYRQDLPLEYRNNFRWNSLTLNQIGEQLKVLSRVAYIFSNPANVNFLDKDEIKITVRGLSEDGNNVIILRENGPIWQTFLDYSFFRTYSPEIRERRNTFNLNDARYHLWHNFSFARDILLASLRD